MKNCEIEIKLDELSKRIDNLNSYKNDFYIDYVAEKERLNKLIIQNSRNINDTKQSVIVYREGLEHWQQKTEMCVDAIETIKKNQQEIINLKDTIMMLLDFIDAEIKDQPPKIIVEKK